MIQIGNPARLTIEDSQLVIHQDESVPIPLEDIGALVLEAPDIILSSSLLSRCAEVGMLILTCDKSHLPICAALPFAGHSRLSGVQRCQLETTVPFRKRCWQAIVRAKIANQAKCLRILERPGADKLESLADGVSSGDASNVESTAARMYFRFLFGPDFVRGDEDITNSALNYGYAILRGAVARALAAHGFLLTQGLHHRSELNPFNLADDFIEPFRPMADLCAAGEICGDGEELEKRHRQMLVSLLGRDIAVDGAAQSALRAADITAGSFVSACREGDARLLKLPSLLPPGQHSYE